MQTGDCDQQRPSLPEVLRDEPPCTAQAHTLLTPWYTDKPTERQTAACTDRLSKWQRNKGLGTKVLSDSLSVTPTGEEKMWQSSTVAGVWWLKVQQTFWFTKSFHDVFGGVLAVWVWGIWLFDVTFVWAAAHSYIGHNHTQAGETSQQQHQEQQSRKGQQAFRVPDRRNTHTDQTGAFITKWECFSEEMAERSHDTLISLHCTLTHE